MVRGLIGVVHLPPMPGDPKHDGTTGFAEVRQRALADADALIAGGVDGLILENFGSAPFPKGCAGDRLPPHQVALLAVAVRDCLERTRAQGRTMPIGVNCLRNDVVSALGIAAACGLGSAGQPGFVRVNVHTGAYVTDQGLIEGEAAQSLRYRRSLAAEGIAIVADVLVKHAQPLAPIDATTATRDCLQRGLADAAVVTGIATGAPVDLDLLHDVTQAAGSKPVLIGSGLTPETAATLAPLADGAIVGTWLKIDGHVHNPVAPQRVRDMVAAVQGKFRQR